MVKLMDNTPAQTRVQNEVELQNGRVASPVTEAVLPGLMRRLFVQESPMPGARVTPEIEKKIPTFRSASYCNNCGQCKGG